MRTPALREKRFAMMRNVVEPRPGTPPPTRCARYIREIVETRPDRRLCPIRAAVRAPQRKRAVIIGAGPTGLSAAYHLGEESLLLEQHDEVGGWCRSVVDNGFTFDYAGHIMFSNDPYVHEMYEMLLGDNVHWQDREAWIYSKDVYTRYPFQGALLWAATGCTQGMHRRRHRGPIRIPEGKDHARPPIPQLSERQEWSCKRTHVFVAVAVQSRVDYRLLRRRHHRGFNALLDTARSRSRQARLSRIFEEFIYGVWGSGVAKHFAVPYNRKLWAVPLTEMETSWLGGRVPMPDLEEMIDGALRPVAAPAGPQRALWLSTAWRIQGAHGWFPART